MFTKAFLKDAFERIVATFIAVLVGVFSADGFSVDSLGDWKFWAPILITTAITAGKAILAKLANGNTGASFGTAVPVDQTAAVVDIKTGQTVATDATPAVESGRPVDVVPKAA